MKLALCLSYLQGEDKTLIDHTICEQIDQHIVDDLIDQMPNKIPVIIDANGGHVKFRVCLIMYVGFKNFGFELRF